MPEEGRDYLTLIGSLIGVTALIYVSKGYPLGQDADERAAVVIWRGAGPEHVDMRPRI